jgi:hypothetical protein
LNVAIEKEAFGGIPLVTVDDIVYFSRAFKYSNHYPTNWINRYLKNTSNPKEPSKDLDM